MGIFKDNKKKKKKKKKKECTCGGVFDARKTCPVCDKKSKVQGGSNIKKEFLEKCQSNTQNILQKIAEKREEFFKTENIIGKEKQIEEGFNRMADYITSINWEKIIDDTLEACRFQDVEGNFTDRVDRETARYFLNLQFQEVKTDMNKMIIEIIELV